MDNFEIFKKTLHNSTQQAAIAAAKKIKELHQEQSDPSTKDYKALGRFIDGAAVKAMQEVFETQPYFAIEIRGSEGRKDTRRDGIASPDLYGSYGPTTGIKVEVVNDAVEGTSFASRNIPGSTSVLAACLNQKNGITPTGDFDYMSKLFGPPELKGKISLDFSPSENFKIALTELKLKNPTDLAVVILDRPRNQFVIDSAQKMGLTTILISGGDLIPGLIAVQDPYVLSKIKSKKIPKNIKALLLIGSGGWEEGIIVAAAAKALGGHAQSKIYSENQDLIEQAKVLEVDDLIPAKASSLLISATPITDDPWFGIKGVRNEKAKTILITSQGLEIFEV